MEYLFTLNIGCQSQHALAMCGNKTMWKKSVELKKKVFDSILQRCFISNSHLAKYICLQLQNKKTVKKQKMKQIDEMMK